jgi:hypothetical protein
MIQSVHTHNTGDYGAQMIYYQHVQTQKQQEAEQVKQVLLHLGILL